MGLELPDRLLVVAVYYRKNLTMRQLAALFGISASTIGRIIQEVGPHLALAPASRRAAEFPDRLWIVDGTMIPVRDRDVAASSRNTGWIVPHRKRTGRPLLAIQEADNAEHCRVRARVERVFARMKNLKVLRDCRVRGDGLNTAVQAVADMHNLAMAG